MSKPAFQRRHHIALADAIRRARTLAPHHDSPAEALRDLQETVADLLARDNPKFSRSRFETACQPTHPEMVSKAIEVAGRKAA